MTFPAEAGRPYHLWVRARAENNGWANDSVHVQFDGTVAAGGSPVYRVGTTSSAEVNLEDCSGCGVSGWGWQDNGYGVDVPGAPIYFAATGPHRLRVQIREDGIGIDQIVLSGSALPLQFAGDREGRRDDSRGQRSRPAAARTTRSLFMRPTRRSSPEHGRHRRRTAAGGTRLQSPTPPPRRSPLRRPRPSTTSS